MKSTVKTKSAAILFSYM